LKIYHSEPERLNKALGAIGADELAQIEQTNVENTPGLSALVKTPRGPIEIS
jgi:hypothetical protein